MEKIVYFLKPSGFCLWVEGAINKLEKIIEIHPEEQIYCIHEIVHNPNVVKYFKDRWVIFVDSIEEIKDNNSIVAFSAHWVNRTLFNNAKERFSKVYSLECPLVNKVYKELENYKEEKIIFYIGKKWHAEAEWVSWYAKDLWKEVFVFQNKEEIPQIDKNLRIWVLSQTTLNFLDVKDIFIEIKNLYPLSNFPPISDVCKATFERQSIIKENIERFSAIIIIWWKESSNTKELCKIAEKWWKEVFFWESLEEILEEWKENILKHSKIAVSWWASTPYEDIEKVLNWLLKRAYLRQEINFNK